MSARAAAMSNTSSAPAAVSAWRASTAYGSSVNCRSMRTSARKPTAVARRWWRPPTRRAHGRTSRWRAARPRRWRCARAIAALYFPRSSSKKPDRSPIPTTGRTTMRCFRFAICCGGLVLASCAGQTPKTTGGLDLPLQPSQYPGTLVYRAPDIQPGKYKAIFVDSADIYRAADADFGGASEADKARLAEKLSTEFKSALTKHHYPLATQPGEGVVRLHLILAGIKE